MNTKDAEKILRQMALREAIPLEYIRAEILKAIKIGMDNPDPEIKAFWATVPRKGEIPTPEELICYLATKGMA